MPSIHEPCMKCRSKKCCCSSLINNNNNIVVPPVVINGTPPAQSTSSNIQFAFAESKVLIEEIPEETETPILSIPAFTTTGQSVNLDAMTNVFIQRPISTPEYSLQIFHRIYRDGNLLADTQDFIQVVNGARQLTLNLTWVDVPPPGTHSYELRIIIRTTPDAVLRQVLIRSLTATLFPPDNILPSTNL